MTTPRRTPAAEIAARTDPGRDPDKQVNEDAYAEVETPLGLLAVVCDGMGGHAGGKEASELAVKTIVERVSAAAPDASARAVLRQAIEDANARVWSMPTAEAGYRPGSTVVAVLLHEGGAEIGHVGDSRIYLVHAGAIAQVTRDHSMVQEMVDRNLIRPEDAATHPDANKILRALGIGKDVEVDVRPEPVPFVAGDVFVLCSDGLSDLVGASEILQIAGSTPPAQAAGQLVDLANARGGHDNITAMVVLMKESSATREQPTVLRTVPLTAHDGPTDEPPGPTGTLVAPPIGAAPDAGKKETPPTLVSPVANVPVPAESAPKVVEAPPPVAIPRAPQGPPSVARPRGPMLAGVALALVAIVLLGLGAWLVLRPKHQEVRIIDDDPREAAARDPDDDDAGPDPVVTPAPPLSPPEHDGGHGRHHRRGHEAGAGPAPTPTPQPTPTPPPPPSLPQPTAAPLGPEPSVCQRARDARARGTSTTVVHALEAQCRAQGGAP